MHNNVKDRGDRHDDDVVEMASTVVAAASAFVAKASASEAAKSAEAAANAAAEIKESMDEFDDMSKDIAKVKEKYEKIKAAKELVESQYIDMILYVGDVNDGVELKKSDFYEVQLFDYHLNRMLGEKHEVLNATSEAIMNIAIKIPKDTTLNTLYKNFLMDTLFTFSIISNATFGSNDLYTNKCGMTMITHGYILEMREELNRRYERDMDQLITLYVKIMMLDLKYVNKDENDNETYSYIQF